MVSTEPASRFELNIGDDPMTDLDQPELLLYRNEERLIRATMIDSVPWFLLADLCKVLEYAKSGDALRFVAPEDQQMLDMKAVLPVRSARDTGRRYQGLARDAWFVTESGAYDIVFESRAAGRPSVPAVDHP